MTPSFYIAIFLLASFFMQRLQTTFSSFRFRKRVLALADAFIVVVASLITNSLFTLFNIYILAPEDVLISHILCVILCFSALLFLGAYNKLWRYLNFEDYKMCVEGVIAGILGTTAVIWQMRGYFPIRYATVHIVLAAFGVCAFRYMFKRAFVSLVATGRKEAKLTRTMIIGAGQACRYLMAEVFSKSNEMQSSDAASPFNGFSPVCIIDDDRSKLGDAIKGVQIMGTTNDIVKLCKEQKIEQILFAIPSCPAKDRQAILDVCAKTNLPVKVLPFYGSLLADDAPMLNQIRDIKVEDLLGREPVKFDNQNIRNFIEGKICMVTGGGGSIGSELVRQIAKYSPKKVIIVDIYENNAYDIQQELSMEYGSSLDFSTLIASVRDMDRMDQILGRYKPDVIFHAAAHKHVPLMEYSPMEAIKNNVIGTFKMASLAVKHGVKKFVMISTDKAVNPTNVMGASKRCCEMVVQYFSQQEGCCTDFITTRFGNVLGSNGSVIPLFKRQIEKGGPVTVTHPDIIRYFMTIPEAVSLVMEAASIAKGGQIFVLDMGQPVKIVSLAENIIRMYGKVPYKDVEIKFTGLRPGEKIKEELLMNEEGLQKTQNKLIYIGKQIEVDNATFAEKIQVLRECASKNDDALAVKALHDIVPTFTTPEEFNSKVMGK